MFTVTECSGAQVPEYWLFDFCTVAGCFDWVLLCQGLNYLNENM